MAEANGGVSAFYDDTQVIQLSKDYGVVPLMLLSTLSPQGEKNKEVASEIMSNEEVQEIQIENILNIMRAKGYYGINANFNFINPTTVENYLNFLTKISNRMKQEGYMVFVTINPAEHGITEDVFERLDYSGFAALVENIIFLHFIWGSNVEPPMPVFSYSAMYNILGYVTQTVPPEKIVIGIPIVGYDWVLPYISGQETARSITPFSALDIARENNSIIRYDEASQTPYYEYQRFYQDNSIPHIVWYINSVTIHAATRLISEYGLSGIAIWNIMVYFPQLWLVINSEYEVVKLIS
jgi:spore germination protein